MMDKYQNIPKELKIRNQWVCYELVYDEKRGKNDKMPKNPHNGYNARSNDSTTWGNYNTAVNAVKRYGFDGIGFELSNGIFGIDLDNVIDENGKLTNEAEDIVDTLDSYTEYSPSGKGLHILCKGEIPSGRNRNKFNKGMPQAWEIEMYSERRFFTVTGNILEGRNKLEQRSGQAKIVFDKYLKIEPKQTQIPKSNNYNLSDNEIIERAKNAKNCQKFNNLWNGNIGGYKSESEADQALCNILAFYCGNDFNRIDSLFKQSGLHRKKWNRQDYKSTTISKAINGCKSFYGDKNNNFNQLTYNSKIHKVLDEDSLTDYLKENGISIRYNVIKREIEIKGISADYNPETIHNDLPVIIHDKLKKQLKKCDKVTICDLLSVIAGKNRFNPVIEMLERNKWDGKDRVAELFSILNIPKDDKLSRTLIMKWLWQALSLSRNELQNAFGADGILVLQGKQGIGKTTFVRKMSVSPNLCKTGLYLDNKDKDTYRRCCSAWIIELGEIETTFKSDLERLKAFITANIDEYRLPYGRSDQILARRTSIIGTCNSEQFLIDPTGSRRFWTIPITEIDLERLAVFDSLQLWLEIEEKTKNNRQGFRLTKAEQEELRQRNTAHEKFLKGQAEIMDILAKTDSNLVLKDVTVSEFKENHSVLRPYSSQQISTVLNKLEIEQKIVAITISGKRTTKKVRSLPVWGSNYYG